MLHICCIRAGAAFAPAYVSNLFDMVRRNLADGFEGEFVCFTDQPDELDAGVVVRPLPADLPGWWSKLALFREGLFPAGDRVLFFDLDTLITGRLDEIAAYHGPLAMLQDFYRPGGLQSSVMAWEAGRHTDIWESYLKAGCPQDDQGGDQAWVESICLDTTLRLQTLFPGAFVSFKQIKGPPDKASVVVFHGKPRPHEVISGWVPEVWKIGGMTRAELDVICNTEREKLDANFAAAIALDLPWFDTASEHDGHACIVGGGPSLKETLGELAWRKDNGQKVFALNGAGRFLHKNSITPDAVMVVDARIENAAFFDGLPAGTAAYIASQCHPRVFEAARKCGLKVIVWHVNTEGMIEALKGEKERPVHLIGGGSTVGLNTMVLAYAAGYRKIHLYGFDSSFREDRHHVYNQGQNDEDRRVDALYGDRRFLTTPWMAQQVNDFVDLVPGLVADGCIITVAGDGLLPTVAADLMDNMPASPAEQRAIAVVDRVSDTPNAKGVEVGVFAGDMSRALLRMKPDLHLAMVDSWEGEGAAYTGDSGDFHAGLSLTAQENFYNTAVERTQFAEGRRTIVRSRSVEAAGALPGDFDFVFLDADHSYEGCKADIEAWLPKVRPGGWLGGHDYENRAFPKFGVTRAVNELVDERGLELELAENFCWFVKIPAIPQTEQTNGCQ